MKQFLRCIIGYIWVLLAGLAETKYIRQGLRHDPWRKNEVYSLNNIYSGSAKLVLPPLPPYPSYPPPLPLWAINKPRRRFEPFFGPKRQKPTPSPAPPTSTPALPTQSPFFQPCRPLPTYCDSIKPYQPLPIQCIDICAVDMNDLPEYCRPLTGDLPLNCIQIIQARSKAAAAAAGHKAASAAGHKAAAAAGDQNRMEHLSSV